MKNDSIYTELHTGPAPRAEGYVANLERLRDWNDVTLCRELCEVARNSVNAERRDQRISLDDWNTLRERISHVEEWLIEHDRWK